MGQYALENHEQYMPVKVRPQSLPQPPPNPGYGRVLFADASQCLAARKKDGPQNCILAGAPNQSLAALLDARPSGIVIPAQTPGWLGVLPKDVWALLPPQLFAQADGAQNNLALLLDVGHDTRLDCGQALAEYHLQQAWQTHRVVARVQGELTPQLAADLLRWHVAACDAPAPVGCDLTLRRAHYPRQVSAGGALPLRLWLDSRGSCPVYEPLRVALRLQNDSRKYDIACAQTPDMQRLGDITHNEILHLPQLEDGEYTLHVGWFLPDGRPFALNMDAPCREGYYLLGPLQVDQIPRPALWTIWEHYYPEGYYPLEDSSTPAQEEA